MVTSELPGRPAPRISLIYSLSEYGTDVTVERATTTITEVQDTSGALYFSQGTTICNYCTVFCTSNDRVEYSID